MNSSAFQDLSRREFIRGCCAAVTATGLLSAMAQLRVIGAVAQPTVLPGASQTESDYKALVCIFLSGGNDGSNTLIPHDSAGYAGYVQARGELALAQDTLLGIAPRTTDGRTWALHPALKELHDLFTQGKLAVLANVGTLVVPTTRQQYLARSVPLPYQLFSHNDQQVEWQSSVADKPDGTGWGGRMADLTHALNSNSTISMSISLNGRNSFQVGRTVAQYSVSPTGAINLASGGSAAAAADAIRTAAMRDILGSPTEGLYQAAFGETSVEALNDSALLADVLGASVPFKTSFPAGPLGSQLRTVARLIAVRQKLGLRRQIFFARNGGWDLHGAQLRAQSGLLGDLSKAMAAFQQALEELGVGAQVTTFTASDFGRTYNSNGDGTDHGWGSHHFIMGGAVRGGDIYGRMPELRINGPDDAGRGRWIPTTSVDEYSARLALWFGVSPTNLPVVLPNIPRFNHQRSELNFI